jgi:hypothetical protein
MAMKNKLTLINGALCHTKRGIKMQYSLTEARQEWQAIEGEKLSFIKWLRWNGLDINGDRYEWKNQH